MNKLLVNEIYDRLIVQGEGPSVGRLATFIRLATCNLHCFWCDTAYSWRYSDKYSHKDNIVYDIKKEVHRMTNEEIISKLLPLNPPMIIISGGEPLLQADKLSSLVDDLINQIPALTRIEFETAGTIFDDKLAEYPFVFFNVSPKLENSRNPKELRYNPDVLRRFNKSQSIFKFVVCEESDFDEIASIVDEVGINPEKIFIMPEGIDKDTQEDRLQYLADAIINRRWNLTPRLHVMVWGNKRGV